MAVPTTLTDLQSADTIPAKPNQPTQEPSLPKHRISITSKGSGPTQGLSQTSPNNPRAGLSPAEVSSLEDFIFLPSQVEPVGKLTGKVDNGGSSSSRFETTQEAVLYPRYLVFIDRYDEIFSVKIAKFK